MSAATALQPAPDAAAREFMSVWASTMTEVVSQIAGTAFSVKAVEAPTDVPLAHEHDLQLIVAAAGSLVGEMSLRVPRITVLALGQLFLQEAQDPAAEPSPDHRDAVEELLRQVTGQVATALNSRWGEAQLKLQTGSSPLSSPCALLLEWGLSSTLGAALQPVAVPEPVQGPAKPVPASSQLDTLMDVKLDVTLRFGRRSMTLAEIMELDAGSIVELDRQVQEPAELLLEGRLIARGEVVVVDGNYGLRVLEAISSPDKR